MEENRFYSSIRDKVTCPACFYDYNLTDQMKKHLLSYLKKNLIVRCDNCRKYFSISAKIDFVALFLGKEEKDDPKRCMICGIPKTVLDEKSCHEEENGFFCSYCRQKIIGGKKECPSLS